MHHAKTAKFSVIELGVPPATAVAESPKAVAPKAVAPKAVAPKAPTPPSSSSTSSKDVDGLSAAVVKKQSEIKALKKAGAKAEDLASQTAELDGLRATLAEAQAAAEPVSEFPRRGRMPAQRETSDPGYGLSSLKALSLTRNAVRLAAVVQHSRTPFCARCL